jgi:hypothetical protein
MQLPRITDVSEGPVLSLIVGTTIAALFISTSIYSEATLWRRVSSTNTVTINGAPAKPQFYVATTGNDASSGTSTSAPWRTIQKAMNSATPGSTVNIMAGTYHERLTLGVSGMSGNYIVFQPYGFSVPASGCAGYTGTRCRGDQVILDYTYLGTVSDGVPFLAITGKSYIRIQGLKFQNFTTKEVNYVLNQGVRVDGTSKYVEFKYSKFLNNKEIGPDTGCCAFAHIRVWGPASHVWFYGNELGNIVTVYGEALTADAGAQYFTVENNWIHDTDQIAIDAHGGTSNYTIRGNKLEYISVKRDGTVWYNTPSIAIYNDGGNTGVIEGNFIDHAGIGFQALSEPGMPATHDVTIRNNVVQNSVSQAITLGTWYSSTCGDSSVYNISVYNNKFFGNNVAVVIRPMQYTTLKWENNVFANNGTTYSDQSGCSNGLGIGTANHNLQSLLW